MNLRYSKEFLKDISRLSEKQANQLEERLELFTKNPVDPILNNHKLKGRLKYYRSINITGDVRAVFRAEGADTKFVRLATHSELYG